MPIITIQNVSKNFEKIKALSDVTLRISEGEFFGLLGPNGAGKTSLMNSVIGFIQPDEGEIFFRDEKVTPENMSIRREIGYVPQEISLYQELTAESNLKIFGSFFQLGKKELSARIDSALELTQLTDRKKDIVKNFSGGMKRRLNLAVSILQNPSVILCDEPTVGVDPQSRNAIFDMLHNLNADGKTIIYTTHYMEEAERLCTRLAIIDYGKIIAKGNLSELIDLLDKKETIKIKKSAEVLEKLEAINLIGTITEQDYLYELSPNDNFRTNSQVFAELERLQVPSHFLELSRASLEDVFLNMTGRRLRD